MIERVPRLLAELVLVPIVLVVGHDLVFLAAYGAAYQGVLARTGHDPHWESAVATVVAAGALFALGATVRVAWLIRSIRRVHVLGGQSRPDLTALAHPLVSMWARLFIVAVLLFVVQENYERVSAGLAPPGVAVLAAGSGLSPIVIFGLVSLLVAAVATLFRWTIATLEARIARALRAHRPRTASLRRPRLDDLRPASSILGRRLAGRAPPALLLR